MTENQTGTFVIGAAITVHPNRDRGCWRRCTRSVAELRRGRDEAWHHSPCEWPSGTHFLRLSASAGGTGRGRRYPAPARRAPVPEGAVLAPRAYSEGAGPAPGAPPASAPKVRPFLSPALRAGVTAPEPGGTTRLSAEGAAIPQPSPAGWGNGARPRRGTRLFQRARYWHPAPTQRVPARLRGPHPPQRRRCGHPSAQPSGLG
jgi:hypothetical protein